MKNKIYVVLIFSIALINILPLIGLFSPTQMSASYGVEMNSIESELLMQHRALLFGIIGGFVWFSLFIPVFRLPALVMSGVSMIGFLLLVLISGDVNTELMNIFRVDMAGVICLVLVLWMKSTFKLDGNQD